MSKRQLDEYLHPVQLEIFRKMPPEERLRIAQELSRATWNRALAGLSAAHPDLTEAQVLKKFVGFNYGQQKSSRGYDRSGLRPALGVPASAWRSLGSRSDRTGTNR